MSSTTSQPPRAPITLADLHQARASLAQEIELLKNAFVQLKDAEARFKVCNATIDQLAAGSVSTLVKQYPETGQASPAAQIESSPLDEILVPVTSSVFFPGRILSTSHVKIDVGTGVYIQKDTKRAKEYYDRKIKMLNEQFALIEAKGKEKAEVYTAIVEAIKKVEEKD